MGTVDTLVSGMAGTVDLSGVALGCSFYWPAFMFLAGLAYGIAPTTSHFFARKDYYQMHLCRFNAVIIMLVAGLLVTFLLALSPLLFTLINTDEKMTHVATGYIYAVSVSLTCTAIFNLYIAYAQSLSVTKPSLVVGLIQIILDIPLNYIFIFGKFGIPALGGIGCGVTSCLINIICCIGLVIYVHKKHAVNKYKVLKPTRKLNYECMRQYLKLSLPLGLSRTMEVAFFSLGALILSPFGPIVVASHSITLNVSGLIFTIPLCLSMTATIRTAYAMGHRNFDQALASLKAVTIINIVFFLIYFNLVLFLRIPIASLYTADPLVLELAKGLMLLNCIYMLPDCIQCVFSGVLQGFKDSKTIFVSSLVTYWLVGLPTAYILSWGVFFKRLEGYGIWLGFIAAILGAAIIYGCRIYYLFKYRKLPPLLLQSFHENNTQ